MKTFNVNQHIKETAAKVQQYPPHLRFHTSIYNAQQRRKHGKKAG